MTKKQSFRSFAMLLLLLPFGLLAQEAPKEVAKDTAVWKKNGAATLTFANVGLSNWSGGGQSSISVGLVLDGKAVRTTKKTIFELYGNLALGGTRVGDSKNLFKKTDDLLILGTKYGYKLSENWSIPVNLELRTQVLDGYTFKRNAQGQEETDQIVSGFMAPGYLFSGVGIQYQNKVFSASLLPISNRTIFVLNDDLAARGVYADKGNKIQPELGATLRMNLDLPIMKNINLKSSAVAFSKYSDIARIDVTWDALLVMQINKYVTTSFGTNLIYFNDAKIKQEDGSLKQYVVQFKHALMVNVGFKF
jgi:hypothetical protein